VRDDAALLKRIQAIHAQSRGTYGSPRVHALLTREAVPVSRKRVARLMRVNGLKARANRIYRRYPRYAGHAVGIPNRSRERVIDAPNQVWVGDITYLSVAGRWRYLAVVLDKYSRRVIGWRVGKRKDPSLTIGVLNDAYRARRPTAGLIFHSDRGAEYGAYAYRDRLTELKIVQSMNRPKTMGDNANMESFFHSMKSDIYHGRRFTRDDELLSALADYMPRYNTHRMHSALGHRSPVDYERLAA
jgi:putative transposase